MIKNIEDLILEINNGNLREHKFTNVELKRSWDINYGEKISALANRLGDEPSWMVIGIENDGTLSNHTEHFAIQTEEKISQCIIKGVAP